MSGERISIGQQLEAVRFAAERQVLLNTGGRVRDERPESVRDYELQRLLAAVETLTWLKANAESVRAAHKILATQAAGDEA
ncbi:MAG TPA: hypothetical protein VGV17_03090 [Bosea sp. (in: a-proteobacteria)]|jgi:hypothetical protein|uniref:hypothetical protein n=1 Tax=Bosea sp. (in: a-proteobacteria) TaxID=1871050 RepID=UPI002DDD7435|nr:hypothetical protein [Bosea sp. (in: a-proteobacteria)]HEV2552731.1 hypothetical protein [Bosea sp. (in: a-proteobacteria)]